VLHLIGGVAASVARGAPIPLGESRRGERYAEDDPIYDPSLAEHDVFLRAWPKASLD
jgi:hypothetical protein